MRKSAAALFAVIVLVAACGGGVKPVVPTPSAKKPDTSNIKIEGNPSTPVNELAFAAIADL